MQLMDFWCRLIDDYPQMSWKAVLHFYYYMYETGFSAYLSTKTKYHNRFDAEPDVRFLLIAL